MAITITPQDLQERLGFRDRGRRVLSHQLLADLMETAGFELYGAGPALPWTLLRGNG